MRTRYIVPALAAAAFLLPAGPAGAALVEPAGGPATATNGIVLGPDGNFWVAEAYSDSVVRIGPGGAKVGASIPLGGAPSSLAVGPGGKVWVTVTGADELAVLDAASPDPVPTFIATGSTCGPVAIVDGGDGRMYFSLPADDGCAGPSRLGSVPAGGGAVTLVGGGGGQVFDLAVSGGKLFAPDLDGGVIRRLSLGASPAVEATLNAPAGSAPDGITADGSGTLWVTGFGNGTVLRFPATASAVQTITPTGGTLVSPFGIVASADGHVYVLGADSQNVLRLNADGTGSAFYATPAGSRPWQIVDAPDGELRFTDLSAPRTFRFVNATPRVAAGAATPTAADTATAQAFVDPRGNPTSVVFDYGPTTAYGQTSAATELPGGASAVPVTGTLPGLAPGTTYHVRVRAANGEGTAGGADTTFTTPPAGGRPATDADRDGVSPPADCNDANAAVRPGAKDAPGDGIDQDCSGKDAALPRLAATAGFTYASSSTTTIRTLRLTRLRGGETATVRCTGSKRCPFRTKTYRGLKRGTKTLGRSLWKGRRLPARTVVSVRVTRAGYVGTSTVLTVRKGRRPAISKACVKPGATRTSACV